VDFPEDRPDNQRNRRYKITLAESEDRRVVLRDFLANCMPREVIYAEMAVRYAMSESAVNRLIDELQASDEKLELEDSKHRKRRQLQRLHRQIEEAERRGQMNAVMKGEELIANIEGNLEPRELRVNAGLVMAGALAGVLAGMTEERARELIEQHVRIKALDDGPTAGARLLGPVQDAEFEPVA